MPGRRDGPRGSAAPIVLGLFKPVVVPDVIRAEMARTPRGQVTVVDFVDFECPFCRLTQAELEPVLEAHKDRVRLVRRQVPLHSHPHAHDAASAACCGEKLGKGNEMAAALFAADVEALTPAGCQKLAEQLGMPADPYKACVVDPSTDARIEADHGEFKSAGGYALPTIWIGRRQLVGARFARGDREGARRRARGATGRLSRQNEGLTRTPARASAFALLSSSASPLLTSSPTPKCRKLIPAAYSTFSKLCDRHCSPICPMRTMSSPNEPEISTWNLRDM